MTYYNEHNPPLGETRPITSRELTGDTQPSLPKRTRGRGCSPGCARYLILLAVILGAYFFAPLRNNLLVLGIDQAPEGTAVGRSDTIIITSVQPLFGQVNMLSIPRDLWLPIPGYGENRINAAHAFGEAAQAGSGPRLAMETVENNFGVNLNYYLRIRLEGFADVIDALGGVEITLEQQVAGFPPGTHTLNGEQALAFVRDRTGDDFFRMHNGQLFVVTLGKKMLNPITWLRIPGAVIAFVGAMDTNLPIWLWPRIGISFLRAIIFSNIDARTIPREAITPWVTAAGAQVLLPNWDAIHLIIREMFAYF